MAAQKIAEHMGITDLTYIKNVGPFYFTVEPDNPGAMPEIKQYRLQELYYFYPKKMISVFASLTDVVENNNGISLRIIDWLVTNYAKTYSVKYTIYNDDTVKIINVYQLYVMWRRNYKRILFDPFRRNHKLYYIYKDRVCNTTAAQVNFFFFLHEYELLKYILHNRQSIEQDQVQCLTKARERKRNIEQMGNVFKRHKLSFDPPPSCTVHELQHQYCL